MSAERRGRKRYRWWCRQGHPETEAVSAAVAAERPGTEAVTAAERTVTLTLLEANEQASSWRWSGRQTGIVTDGEEGGQYLGGAGPITCCSLFSLRLRPWVKYPWRTTSADVSSVIRHVISNYCNFSTYIET